MVFGWGKKEKRPQIIAPKEIDMSDIIDILDDIYKTRTKTLVSQANVLREKINPAFLDLQRIADALESDDLKTKEIDKRLQKILMHSKALVVSTIRSESRSNFTALNSHDNVVSFGKKLNQNLKKIGDVLGRESRVIHAFANKYAEKLKETLTILESEKSELFFMIKNYQQTIQGKNIILDAIKQIDNIKKSKSKNINKIDTHEKTLQETDILINSNTKNISDIKSSKQYTQYISNKTRLNEFNKTRGIIKSEIDTQFIKISRPLGKYQHVSSDKDKQSTLNALVDNPIDVLIPENKKLIIEILQSVRKATVSNSISVKDIDKTIQYLDETTEMLNGFTKKVSDFENEKSILEKKLDSFDISSLYHLEDKLKKQLENKKNSQSKIIELNDDTSQLDENIPKLITSIESQLNDICATRYTIKR